MNVSTFFVCMEYMQATIRADPTEIQFSEMKTDERSSIGETTVSILLRYCQEIGTTTICAHN